MDGNPSAVGEDLGLHGLEFVDVAADDRHVGAQCREFVGSASPDPAGPAGDDDRPTGEQAFGKD
jgi:hypothetical protein